MRVSSLAVQGSGAGLAGEDVELRMIESTGTAPLHALESDEPGALEGGPQ